METKVSDPDLVDTFDADDRGRINLGTDFSNDSVRVAVERIEDEQKERVDN